MNRTELKMLQALPLDIKRAKSKQRLREAIDYFGKEHLYLSVSGGLDSTAAHLLLQEVEEEDNIPSGAIPRVNSNTGNEYDGVLKKAREISDVEVKPLKPFYKVITEEGYPVGSKKVSRMLRDLQNPTEDNFNSRRLYLEGIKQDGTLTKSFKLPQKWRKFIDSAVKCSEKCCFYLKKQPLQEYEKRTERTPIIAVLAEEGGTREHGYLDTGCNAFECSRPQSKPVGFWTHNDILMYLVLKEEAIPPEYGDIVFEDTKEKVTKSDVEQAIKEGKILKLTTTLEKRTGCVCCTYGVTQENGENRFQRLKKLDPKRYNFCIYGGEIRDGKLVPKGGLGLGYILDMMGISYDNDNGQIKGQLSMFNTELNERINIGDKYINNSNGIIAEVIQLDKDSVLVSQTKGEEKSYNITLNLEWILGLIDNGTIKKIS